LFTNARHVPKTKQNLISIRNLVENCFKRWVVVRLYFSWLVLGRRAMI